ncbi:peptidoglycan-associated lipoprotein Pal [Desulfuromonas thiophila]|jgi:peptidoglycan-associated lipoprotein|uniref:Peptidoglycan-associated lipoprotein n=1 Tax=Desulfuromonas thiophila TaxID=57664 RepID=A0A1G7E7B5_9BACT|nr:peptidoglycan-associated lipoprotein Pal [Desulfuromonas thiophila]MDD3801673.1 peptidoglycan-associated lipoprotein Pal [Desulfuromonas thiophila]MDY0398412.1 peptidoglycan-associated lipoprotein Pal [Desulfuromonas thiophila]SDE59591.1 peptidoglycan-associated lipoprotein [Desulfuromonas thiophila]
MKAFKLLIVLSCAALLAAGCAKPYKATDKVPTNSCDPAEEVPSYAVAAEPVSEAAAAPAATAELQRIHFDFDQHVLRPDARETLQQNARYLEINPQTGLVIEGHCDERGSDEYNLALGERRAKAAAEYLKALGIAPERLRTLSYGEEMPLVRASNEEAWAMNRRAEFNPQQ